VPPTATLRPVAPGDEELLYRIYASTRTEELAPVPWTEAQKEAFLRMQFAAQSRDYATNYPTAAFLVILVDGTPAGRLYVDRRQDELLIVDIALLPEHRGGGIGGAILSDVLAEAAAAGKPARIHVEHLNPALRLYERLGFRRIADQGIYLLMEWTAGEGAALS
jgi:ribosomal protein S18 acetylase RimI-like enzyme